MHTPTAADKSPIVIRKYPNRRLYNTASSTYASLDQLATMARDGTEFVVIDAKTGHDVTCSILTQVIIEQETHGQTLLPIIFMRQVIALYGDAFMGLTLPRYLECAMNAFVENQDKMRRTMEQSFNGLLSMQREHETEENRALVEKALEKFAIAPPPTNHVG